MFNADRQLDDHREFREASTEAAGSYRFIWSRLLNTDTPSEQFVALLLIACRQSHSVSIHVGRSIIVVNIRSFVKRQRKWPGRTVSSDRVVPFHLVSVAEHEHAVRTVRRVTLIACRRSQSVSIHVGRSIVVNIRLTARLQSLPLARC